MDARVGLIPFFIQQSDPRPAAAQFNERYAHGGGWMPMDGWTLDPDTHAITYPGDGPLEPIDAFELRDETIAIYEDAWVAIVQKDGSFEVSRMD